MNHQSKWIVESPTHLRMLPEMEKPVFPYPNNYWNMTEKEQDEFDKPFIEYSLALRKMQTIHRGDEGFWKIGQIINAGQFEVCDKMETGRVSYGEIGLRRNEKYTVAIPKQQESEESEDSTIVIVGEIIDVIKLKEFDDDVAINKYLNEHYSIKRK